MSNQKREDIEVKMIRLYFCVYILNYIFPVDFKLHKINIYNIPIKSTIEKQYHNLL